MSRSRRLYAGHQLGTQQVTPQPCPRAITTPWFRCHLGHLDTSSTVHSRSTPRLSPDMVNAMPFPSTLTTRALDPSSSWRFEACACTPAPGGPPPSSTKHRNAVVPSLLIQRSFRTHDDAQPFARADLQQRARCRRCFVRLSCSCSPRAVGVRSAQTLGLNT